jgi:hypothetical protein
LTRRRKDVIGLVGPERGADEIDIERSSLLFADHIVHATEAVLRGTEHSLLLTFGSRGELFEKRVRSLAGQVDGLPIAEEVLDDAQLRALAAQLPIVTAASRPPGSCSAASRCRRPWSARTTRWLSAC